MLHLELKMGGSRASGALNMDCQVDIRARPPEGEQ